MSSIPINSPRGTTSSPSLSEHDKLLFSPSSYEGTDNSNNSKTNNSDNNNNSHNTDNETEVIDNTKRNINHNIENTNNGSNCNNNNNESNTNTNNDKTNNTSKTNNTKSIVTNRINKSQPNKIMKTTTKTIDYNGLVLVSFDEDGTIRYYRVSKSKLISYLQHFPISVLFFLFN